MNVHCKVTNHNKDKDTQASNNKLTTTASCSLVFSCLIGFFLEQHKNIPVIFLVHTVSIFKGKKLPFNRASDILRKKSKFSWDFQGQIRGKIGRFRGKKVKIRGKIGRFCGIFAGEKSKFTEKSADLAGF